jgi:hypothetical protein
VHLNVTNLPPFIVDLILIEALISFLSLKLWHRAWSHLTGLKLHKQNEESLLESSLDLTLTQHPRDEEPEPREVRIHLEVEPLRA